MRIALGEREEHIGLDRPDGQGASEYLAFAIKSHQDDPNGSSGYTQEVPEMLQYVLDHAANIIVDLDARREDGTLNLKLESGECEEDARLRTLRLNLLALAKRAPLDKIQRLPVELVPEHIRQFVPTVAPSLSL